jgi:GDPmannose 4,6-dehydratase
MRKALITGITGQDGSYLAELLLENGYQVWGLVRRVALEDASHRLRRIQHIADDVTLVPASLESYPSLHKALSEAQPDEVYHLGGQSYVSYSFDDEFSTLQTNINGTHFLLSAVKDVVPDAKFYHAGSSEMFGKVREVPQTEMTPFHPRSPYGISKVASFHLTRNYREAYGMFAVNGILYNHESPRRGFEFVTRKITSHVAMIHHGLRDQLELGNLDAKRDWGHARDYVRAMHQMLCQDEPDDYVVCSGAAHSVRDFCQRAFAVVGLNYEDYVITSERFFRPAETDILLGCADKAQAAFGWQPTVTFDELVLEMVEHDLRLFAQNPRAADHR